ncbi:hypothetical protein JK361_38840 [Streptomyces sp. 5-8]|uniref:Uncharacterized protein n=1 Tax=Streptomyces musisoli TaxID=2802280 RepID=A0ABS1PDK2_9ACTN|nr:hypothetical protein [Streptomyces musisoli]MBL1110438.1 hypothetical protein [Streptomyces musisoli]
MSTLARPRRWKPVHLARIVVVQGTPDNELIDLWNRSCVPLTGQGPDHQGYLLTLAGREFAAGRFTDISFTRAPVDVVFPEDGPEGQGGRAGPGRILEHRRPHPGTPA